MKKISDIPNISKEMKAIYGKLLEKKGSFEGVLPLLDAFLEKYPHYPEALVFKARALMGLGRDSEAMKYLKMAKKVDKWRLIGTFDQAEIHLQKRKNEESIKVYVEAVKAYATELKNGIDSYLLCCNSENAEEIRALTQEALMEFFANDDENKPFEKLTTEFMKMKDGFHYY